MRQGLELPRPRLLGRAHPAPAPARGRRLPARLLGRGARRGRRGHPARARRVRRRVDPALQLHGHAGADPGQHDVGPRDERARRVAPRAHDLRHRRLSRARSEAHGVSPEVDPEEWPNARYLLIWGWNPMSTAPHLWLKLLDARKARRAARGGRPVPQPHRAGGRRAPPPAAGHRRRARDRHDARGRGRRAPGRGLVPRARRRLRRAARRARPDERRGVRRAVRRGRRDDRARGPRVRHDARPRCCGSALGAQRHAGAPAAYATVASLPVLTGAWRDRGGGCSYIPLATAAAISSHPLEREDLRPGTGAHDQHVAARRGAHRSRARPAGQGARLLELEPGRDRAGPGARAGGPAPRRPVHGRARAVHDRHRRSTRT